MPTVVRSRWAALLLLIVGLGGGCGHPLPASSPAAGGRSPSAVAIALGGTDTAWTQLMIPMTAQAATLLELTAHRAGNPRLATLAAGLGTQYRAELGRLRGLLASAGIAETNEHEGHDLPGMITAADLAGLDGRAGADFDAAAGAQLREEMRQSVRLARSEQQAGRDGGCKAIAAAIETARTASLADLTAAIGPG